MRPVFANKIERIPPTVVIRDYSRLLYGNSDLLQMLISDASDGTLSHAYIIEGDDGSGKKTLAVLTFAALACERGEGACLECETCKRILGGLCPDVMIKRPESGKKNIGVETVRKIREEVYITPNELDFKAFIIDGAQMMTNEAQNALLKVLEEPPANVYFFLLCTSSAAILPTVRSRAPVLRMQKFSASEMEEYILARSEKARRMREDSREDFDLDIRAAHGSIGLLKERFEGVEDSTFANRYETVNKIFSLLRDGKKAELLLFCTALPDRRDELEDIYSCALAAVRDMLCTKLSENGEMLFFSSRDEAYSFAEKFTVSELVRLSELCETLRNELYSNVNTSSSKLKFALEL